jgi:hypothetical protein
MSWLNKNMFQSKSQSHEGKPATVFFIDHLISFTLYWMAQDPAGKPPKISACVAPAPALVFRVVACSQKGTSPSDFFRGSICTRWGHIGV